MTDPPTMDLADYLASVGANGGSMRGVPPHHKIQLRNLDHARAWTEETGVDRWDAALSPRCCNRLFKAGLIGKKQVKTPTGNGHFISSTIYWLTPIGRRARELMDT